MELKLTSKSRMQLSVVFLLIVMLGVALAADWDYEFIISPHAVWENFDAQGWDIGVAPREHPTSGLVLWNLGSNLPFKAWQLTAMSGWLDVQVIGSDSIHVWLETNGWNTHGGLE